MTLKQIPPRGSVGNSKRITKFADNKNNIRMKFMIKSVAGRPEKEGDTFIRYTGNSEPFGRGDEMASEKIGVLPDGTPKLRFRTGLEENQIQYMGWFSTEQKEEHKKLLREYRPKIANFFGGNEVIENTNRYFWYEDKERNRIKVTNDTLDKVFDMKNIPHALFYFNVMGGAFLEVIAPTKQMAEEKGIQHYLVIDTDFQDDVVDDYVTKANAYSLLTELDRDGGDALLFLGWVLQSNTKGFGAYTRSSSKNELLKYHAEFIEGKLSKTKRNCPKDFITEATRWKEGGLLKNKLMMEAYLKAAEYYSYLNTNKENKYQLPSGTVLGNTILEAADTILKPKNVADSDALRNFVEAKWKE